MEEKQMSEKKINKDNCVLSKFDLAWTKQAFEIFIKNNSNLEKKFLEEIINKLFSKINKLNNMAKDHFH
jgi:hypothetical protein